MASAKEEAEAARAERDSERRQAQELLADLAFTRNELEMMAPLKGRVATLEGERDAARGAASAAASDEPAVVVEEAAGELQRALDEHKAINLRQVKALAKEKDAREKADKENAELKELLEEAFQRLEQQGAAQS